MSRVDAVGLFHSTTAASRGLATYQMFQIGTRARLAFNRGDPSTEYAEKPVRSRFELRARYFF